MTANVRCEVVEPDFPSLGSKVEVRLTFLPREVTANVRCEVVV